MICPVQYIYKIEISNDRLKKHSKNVEIIYSKENLSDLEKIQKEVMKKFYESFELIEGRKYFKGNREQMLRILERVVKKYDINSSVKKSGKKHIDLDDIKKLEKLTPENVNKYKIKKILNVSESGKTIKIDYPRLKNHIVIVSRNVYIIGKNDYYRK
jgi:hypothetical protein